MTDPLSNTLISPPSVPAPLAVNSLCDRAARMTSSTECVEARRKWARTVASWGHVTRHVVGPTWRLPATARCWPDVTSSSSLTTWSPPPVRPTLPVWWSPAWWSWREVEARRRTAAGSRRRSACALADEESVARLRRSASQRMPRNNLSALHAPCIHKSTHC